MQMTNKTQRHLSRNLTACQPWAYGIPAVTSLRLSRRAPVSSAVTTRYLNRERTAEMPSKVGYFRVDDIGLTVFRFDFAGGTRSMDTQGSCAAGAARLVRGTVAVTVSEAKTKTGGA
jgi:hypothetical protein